jgi:cell division septal protein FtsQ
VSSSPGYRVNIVKGKRRFKPRAFLRFMLIFLLVLVAVGGVGAGTWFLLTSPRLAIGHVSVTIEDPLLKQDAEAVSDAYLSSVALRFFKRNNFFLFSREGLESALSAFSPRAASVTVSKKFPNTADATVLLKKRAGVWCNMTLEDMFSVEDAAAETPAKKIVVEKNKCFSYDEGGYLFEETSNASNPFITVIKDASGGELALGNTISNTDFLMSVETLRKLFVDNAGFVVQYFILRDDLRDDVDIMSGDGYLIKASILVDPAVTVSNYKNILKQLSGKKIEYIDLRLPDRVAYKLAGELPQ